MYFKRGVIILTLGVYNLNVQKFFEWDHTVAQKTVPMFDQFQLYA